MIRDAIILTGGQGTRLAPFNKIFNKHLLNVNGKFIIDYPLSTIQQMGIENLTVVLGGNHFEQIVSYMGDGSKFNLNITFLYQSSAAGIAQAINLCRSQVREKFVCILGDNLFEKPIIWNNAKKDHAQIVLAKPTHTPLNRFGVASINHLDQIIKIEEKPQHLDEGYWNMAIAGCYLFDQNYFEYFKNLNPSPRGEFEIVDIIKQYQQNNKLSWVPSHGLWSDLGTHQSIAYVNDYFYHEGAP